MDESQSPEGLREQLFRAGYIADEDLASLVWMGLALERPLLLEGEAGVGKTAIAAASARALNRPLLRLQCYEGLDLAQSVYEWNYSRQLLEIRLTEAGAGDRAKNSDALVGLPQDIEHSEGNCGLARVTLDRG